MSHAESPPPTSESEVAPTPDNKILQERGYVKESLRDNREIKEWLENGTYDYKIRVQCRCIIR